MKKSPRHGEPRQKSAPVKSRRTRAVKNRPTKDEIQEAESLLPYLAWHKLQNLSSSRAMDTVAGCLLAVNYRPWWAVDLPRPQVPEDFMPGEYLAIRRMKYAAMRYEEVLAAAIHGLRRYDPSPYLRATRLYGVIVGAEDDIFAHIARLQGEARIRNEKARETLRRLKNRSRQDLGRPRSARSRKSERWAGHKNEISISGNLTLRRKLPKLLRRSTRRSGTQAGREE